MDLLTTIGLVDQPVVADTTGNLLLQLLRQVHGVRNCDHKQAGMCMARPIKEVVEESLLFSDKGVQLINQEDP